jgi:hypothetical protein
MLRTECRAGFVHQDVDARIINGQTGFGDHVAVADAASSGYASAVRAGGRFWWTYGRF